MIETETCQLRGFGWNRISCPRLCRVHLLQIFSWDPPISNFVNLHIIYKRKYPILIYSELKQDWERHQIIILDKEWLQKMNSHRQKEKALFFVEFRNFVKKLVENLKFVFSRDRNFSHFLFNWCCFNWIICVMKLPNIIPRKLLPPIWSNMID